MSPKVTTAHTDARRQQILLAAATCFSQKGFSRTTIRDICAEADLSIGAVYGYFANKSEIINALAELGRATTGRLLEPPPEESPVADALASMVAAAADLLSSPDAEMNSRLSVRLWSEALDTPQIEGLLRESMNDLAESYALVVEQGQHRGEIQEDLSAQAIGRLFAVINLGLTVQAVVDPAQITQISQAVESLLGGSLTPDRNQS